MLFGAPRQRKLCVLLGGDAAAACRAWADALRRAGHRCELAEPASRLLSLFHQSRFDAVVIDVQTPGSEVFAAVNAIRSCADRDKALAVLVAVTAPDRVHDRDRCLAAGMDCCLCQPVRPADLVAVITRLAAERAAASATGQAPCPGRLPDFHWQQALHQCFDSEMILRQMAAHFLADADPLLQQMREAVQRRDREALKSLAHQLKGTVLYLGAPRAVLALKRLEDIPWSDDMADAAAAVGEAGRQLLRLKEAVLPIARA